MGDYYMPGQDNAFFKRPNTETPTPATAGEARVTLGPLNGSDAVIARWFIDTYGQSFAVADKSRRDFLTALTAAGFVIHRATPAAEGGMSKQDWYLILSEFAVVPWHPKYAEVERLRARIRDLAAADPAPGEGE
jgi:hypothetical protein